MLNLRFAKLLKFVVEKFQLEMLKLAILLSKHKLLTN